MSGIKVGEVAPDIHGIDQGGQVVQLSQFRGQRTVVLFFYPADESPICTKEACSFRDAYETFVSAGAEVIGVSGDSLDKHRQFASRHQLPFHLLVDTDGEIRRALGVPRSLGLLPGRVTYVIDSAGIVRHIFSSQFSSDRHVQEALEMVRQLSEAESAE